MMTDDEIRRRLQKGFCTGAIPRSFPMLNAKRLVTGPRSVAAAGTHARRVAGR